jgi:hypothetical protein
MYGIKEAARQAGISEELLAVWLKTGEAEATEQLGEIAGLGKYLFDERTIKRVGQLAQLRSRSSNAPRVEARVHAVDEREAQDTLQPGVGRKKAKKQ